MPGTKLAALSVGGLSQPPQTSALGSGSPDVKFWLRHSGQVTPQVSESQRPQELDAVTTPPSQDAGADEMK